LERGQKYRLEAAITMMMGIAKAIAIFLIEKFLDTDSLFEADFAGWENEA